MRKLVEYPTLSLAERDRRWAAVRNEMRARHLECLVLCGWPTMWDFNIANARYLCPIGGNAEFNVLVFPAAGEPTSFIYSPVFTEYWRGAQSWVADVRPRRGTFADSVADRLTELGLTGAKVGIDGLAGPLDPDGWVPHSMYLRLQERLPGVELVNLNDMMEKLRTVKSAEEIDVLQKAAAIGDLMLQACRDTARPGVKECEVYGRMMETMLANGGEEPTLFLWAADAHPYPHPFRVPTIRPLAKGDMIICEMHPEISAAISRTSSAPSAWANLIRATSTFTTRVSPPISAGSICSVRAAKSRRRWTRCARRSRRAASAFARPASMDMASLRWNIRAIATMPRAPTRARSRPSATSSVRHGVRHEHRFV